LTKKLKALYAQCSRLLVGNHQITSQATDAYNCVAWIERDLDRWWEPGFYWPLGIPEPVSDADLDCYIELFESLGYELCKSPDLEQGYLKVAIYCEQGRFQHVAKQLPNGEWSSKIGPLHDVRHEGIDLLEGVGVWNLAQAEVYMRRAYDGVDPFELENVGLYVIE
jgi:hypothetical protein